MVSIAILRAVCFVTICRSGWIQSNSSMFTADDCLSVGFYNGSFYLLGGQKNPKQLTEYVLSEDSFIDHGLQALDTNSPLGIYGYAQYWTQINHLLYVEEHYGTGSGNEGKISIFNLQTKTFTSSVIGGIPVDGEIGMCLTSNSTHLFLLGGYMWNGPDSYLFLVQIYDLSTNEWITSAPSMNSARTDFCCMNDPINNKLYAIGGNVASSSGVLSSIEMVETSDITHKKWTYISGTLSKGLIWSMCVIYKSNIYVIGGSGSDVFPIKKVHVINTFTDEVTLLADEMPLGLSNAAPIVVNHTLYVFGGWTNEDNANEGRVDTWIMYDLNMLPTTPEPSDIADNRISSTTALDAIEQTPSDTSHVMTDLLSSTQLQEETIAKGISPLMLAISAVIILTVIVVVLVVVIFHLQKQVKVEKDIDFIGKSEDNANNNNNHPKNGREAGQSPENNDKVICDTPAAGERGESDSSQSVDSEGVTANANTVIDANLVLQQSAKVTKSTPDNDKNVNQLPITEEGLATHSV